MKTATATVAEVQYKDWTPAIKTATATATATAAEVQYKDWMPVIKTATAIATVEEVQFKDLDACNENCNSSRGLIQRFGCLQMKTATATATEVQ